MKIMEEIAQAIFFLALAIFIHGLFTMN